MIASRCSWSAADMGSQYSHHHTAAADSETCRIVVEHVASSMTSQEMTSPPEVFSPVPEEERRRSSASSETTMYGGSRRGSVLSVDARRSSGGGTPEFWVPESVMKRTRCRSLVPPDQLSPDDNGDVRGARSMQTLVSTLSDQSQQLSPDHVTTRPRRASMYDALDFTKIDASLYQRPPLLSSEKTAALYGSSKVHEENLGSIQFSLEYDPDTSILTLQLMQASDLSSPDPESALPDAYVTVRLLPDTSNHLQTRVYRQTRCPCLDERFIFDVAWSELASRSIEMKIYHDSADESRHDDCIGQVLVPLDQIDLSAKCVLCKGISADDKQAQRVGDILFSLTYLPSAERLTVVVVEARHLRPVNANTNHTTPLSNVYVKATLFVAGKKIKKKKTSSLTTTMSAVWNEALSFSSLSRQQLETTASIQLTMHHGNHGNAVGQVTVGPDNDVGDLELRHWSDMLSGRSTGAKWHQLKPVAVTSQQ